MTKNVLVDNSLWLPIIENFCLRIPYGFIVVIKNKTDSKGNYSSTSYLSALREEETRGFGSPPNPWTPHTFNGNAFPKPSGRKPRIFGIEGADSRSVDRWTDKDKDGDRDMDGYE